MASAKNKSILNLGGKTINISHLEQEIKGDVASYHKYRAEDGMKKRAVHASKDYDEFRNFVSVSQLKPTSGRDLSTLFRGAAGSKDGASSNNTEITTSRKDQVSSGGFEELIQRRKSVATSSEVKISSTNFIHDTTKNIQKLHAIGPSGIPSKGPSTRKHTRTTKKSSRGEHDVFREWKEQCKDSKSLLTFLTRANVQAGIPNNTLLMIPGNTCNEFFSVEIDSTIFGGVVDGLHLFMLISNDCGKELLHQKTIRSLFGNNVDTRTSCLNHLLSTHLNAVTFIRDWLNALTNCGRFDLNICFLARDQHDKLRELCSFVRDSFSDEESMNLLLKYEAALR
ncbi:hypothetical protein ACHAXS_001908 [Conticribra weissflogii]